MICGNVRASRRAAPRLRHGTGNGIMMAKRASEDGLSGRYRTQAKKIPHEGGMDDSVVGNQ